MEINIKVTPEEVEKLLQAIGSSQEQLKFIGGLTIAGKPV